MKKILLLLFILLISNLFGCASKQELQRALNSIDSTWGSTNSIYFAQDGARKYTISMADSREILYKTMKELKLEYQTDRSNDATSFYFMATAPTPLTQDEYDEVREIEEPMMQAIAATDVGKFTSNLIVLSDGSDFDIIIHVVLQEGESDTEVQLDLSMRYKKPNSFIVYGTQPPPEAVRIGLKRFWHTFENHAKATTNKPISQLLVLAYAG